MQEEVAAPAPHSPRPAEAAARSRSGAGRGVSAARPGLVQPAGAAFPSSLICS